MSTPLLPNAGGPTTVSQPMAAPAAVRHHSAMSRRGLAVVLALAILAGAVAGAGSALALENLRSDGSATDPVADSATTVAYDAESTETTVTTIVAEAADAVVSLEIQGSSFIPGQATSGSGSGFFVSEDGLIVTAYHVVEEATAITVMLADGTQTTASLVATDADNDVAILDAEGDGYDSLSLATGGVTVGETVIAIGNALGEYQTTVTTGIVSGTGRSVDLADGRSVQRLEGLIQTDAALASGMSGGPILSLAGEVVGISTADAREADGIAFAEPIGVATELLDQAADGWAA